MIVPSKNKKTYGVLHTENYFSFLGFSKKVNSDEIQKVDVYLDDVLIDTILADKKLQKIEDIYDIEGFGFTYNLPDEYIGEKHIISFKNHETKENIQNSPYTMINKNDDNFNEAKFLYSLSQPIDEEKIKNIYCSNSIGFLATKENLGDEEFVEYIKQIILDFPNSNFKALVLNNNLNEKIRNIFNNLESLQISSLYDIFENIEVYLSNNERNELDTKVLIKLRKYSIDIFCIGIGLNQKNLTIKEHELNNTYYFNKFFNNLETLDFTKNDIEKYGKSYYEIYFKKASEKYNININFDLNERTSKAHVYWNLKLGLNNHEFFKYSLDFAKKFSKL